MILGSRGVLLHEWKRPANPAGLQGTLARFHVQIRLVGKVPLDRLVDAVGVAEEDPKPLLDRRVEAVLHIGREPRNLS